MTTFYIASSRDGLNDVHRVSAALARSGMQWTFPWPYHFDHKCSRESCGISDGHDLSLNELDAASHCDLFVGISRMGKGSHVELGAALISCIPRVILVGVDAADSVFYRMRRVERVQDIESLFSLLGVGP